MKTLLTRLAHILSSWLRPRIDPASQMPASASCAESRAASVAPTDPAAPIPPQPHPIPPQDPRIEPLCDALRRQGRLLPAWEAMGIREFMEELAGRGRLEACTTTDWLAWFARFLESLPPSVVLDETAPDHGNHQHPSPTSAPAGRIDGRSMARHRRALQLMATDAALSYPEALRRTN